MRPPQDIAWRVAENVPAALVYLDSDLRIRFANRYCFDLLGYAPREILGRALGDMVDPRTLRYARSHAAQLERGNAAPLEYVLRHKNGSPRYVKVRAMPDRDRLGRNLGYFACTSESSTERAAQQQLRVAEERLGLALEASEAGIWDWDPATHDIYYSSGFKFLLGYEEATFPGDFAFFGQLHPEDAEKTLDALAAAIEGGACFDCEFRIRCANGGYRWLRGVGATRREPQSGAVIRCSGTVRDISMRKEAELRLVDARALLDAVLDRAGCGRAKIGHELRTPLAAVIAALELLQEGADARDGSLDGSLVVVALQNADRLARLVERLLALELEGLELGTIPAQNRRP